MLLLERRMMAPLASDFVKLKHTDQTVNEAASPEGTMTFAATAPKQSYRVMLKAFSPAVTLSAD